MDLFVDSFSESGFFGVGSGRCSNGIVELLGDGESLIKCGKRDTVSGKAGQGQDFLLNELVDFDNGGQHVAIGHAGDFAGGDFEIGSELAIFCTDEKRAGERADVVIEVTCLFFEFCFLSGGAFRGVNYLAG